MIFERHLDSRGDTPGIIPMYKCPNPVCKAVAVPDIRNINKKKETKTMSEEPKLFEDFVEEKGIKLRPWQEKAAQRFLGVVFSQQFAASGKTFLMKLLNEFINEHGNNFSFESAYVSSRPVKDLVDS